MLFGFTRKGRRILGDKLKSSESKNILLTIVVGIVTLFIWVPTVFTSIPSHTYIILLSGYTRLNTKLYKNTFFCHLIEVVQIARTQLCWNVVIESITWMRWNIPLVPYPLFGARCLPSALVAINKQYYAGSFHGSGWEQLDRSGEERGEPE